MKHLTLLMTACAFLGINKPLFANEPDLETICNLENMPEDQRDAVKEVCDSVRFELVRSQLDELQNAAKLKGLDTDAPNEGTTTFNGVADGYASVLAVGAAAHAGGEMGVEICRQAQGRTIYFGMPQEYRQSVQLKNHFTRRIRSLQDQFDASAGAINEANLEVAAAEKTVIAAFTIAAAEGVANEGAKSLAFAGALAAVNEITGTANLLNDLTKLLRSDVTVTGINPNVPDEAVTYAIKSGILTAARTYGGCRIASPESDLSANNPLNDELDSLYGNLSELRMSQNNLLRQMAVSISKVALTDKTAAAELEKKLKKLETMATNLVNTAGTQTEKIWTELATTNGSGPTSNTTLLDRMISADRAVNDMNAVFLDARQVKSAAAQVHSKGLFRTDRLHFSGSVVVGYELVDRTGNTLGSGMFDSSRAEKIRDRTGFGSRNGRITSFNNVRTTQPLYRAAPQPSYTPGYAPSRAVNIRPAYVKPAESQTIYTYESGR